MVPIIFSVCSISLGIVYVTIFLLNQVTFLWCISEGLRLVVTQTWGDAPWTVSSPPTFNGTMRHIEMHQFFGMVDTRFKIALILMMYSFVNCVKEF
jgi:hypothetical protein